MSQTKLTRSQIKRLAIIDAAKSAFKEFGVQGTSMDKLAQIAQVSKRTVYNHFESKEVLVMTLLKELWHSALVQVDKKYEKDQPLRSQLEAILLAEIKTIGSPEYIDLNRVAFGHLLFHPEKLKQEAEQINQIESTLTQWLRSANEDGRLVIEDISFAHSQIHHLIKGGCFWMQLMQIQPLLDEKQQIELAEQTSAIFLNFYSRNKNEIHE